MSDDHQPGVLSDFQRATARHAFQRLYLDSDSSRRFLVADETGLGKTHVAEEVIARTVEHLQSVNEVDRIDIIYVCSMPTSPLSTFASSTSRTPAVRASRAA